MGHRLEYLLFMALRRVILMLPLRAVQRLGAMLGSGAFLVWTSRRKITFGNLERAFPALPRSAHAQIARAAFRNYGIAIAEFLWFPNLTRDRLSKFVRIANIEVVEQVIARGRGLIFLSGHFGNWELNAYSVSMLCGTPMKIIARVQSNTAVNTIINRHRELAGNTIIPAGIAVREILKALDERGVVAMAPDQSGPVEGPNVLFFGRRAPTHQGPAVFALRTGTPMVMGFIIRQNDGTYEIRFEEVPTDRLAGSDAENIVELTQRYTTLLEQYVRTYPGHWLWMHRRWKHADALEQREFSTAGA